MKGRNIIFAGILILVLVGGGFLILSKGEKNSPSVKQVTPKVTPSKTPEWAVSTDDNGNVVGSINPMVTESILALKQGDKSNVIDPRNNLPVSPNVLTFIDSLNANNAYAVSGEITDAKGIQKLYIDLWNGAKAGGISLRNIISQEDRDAGVIDTDPNPGTVLAIYDSTSNLEYCAVDQTYFGMARVSTALYNQLLVPMSCADFAKK